MKTQRQAIEAYLTLTAMGKSVKGVTAYKLYKLKDKLKSVVEFQSEEEVKIVEKYDGTILEGGKIKLPDGSDREAYEKDMNELHDIECEIEPIEICVKEVPEITIPQIEALEGFIKFIEG